MICLCFFPFILFISKASLKIQIEYLGCDWFFVSFFLSNYILICLNFFVKLRSNEVRYIFIFNVLFGYLFCCNHSGHAKQSNIFSLVGFAFMGYCDNPYYWHHIVDRNSYRNPLDLGRVTLLESMHLMMMVHCALKMVMHWLPF